MARANADPGRESYWRKVLARRRRSGLSAQAFCRAEDVNETQFYWWRRKLGQAGPETPAFVPVRVIPETAGQPATRGIEVVLARIFHPELGI